MGASLPLVFGDLALVPQLVVSVPTLELWPRPLFHIRPALAGRWRVEERLLLGAQADVELPLNPTADLREQLLLRLPRQCAEDAAGCTLAQLYRPWRVHLAAQAEYEVLPALSLAARVDVGLDDSRLLLLLPGSIAPDAGAVMPAWSTVEVRPALELHWAFSEHVGLTAAAAVGVELRNDTTLAPATRYALTSWQGHLSLWFRTDGRLRRAWLER